MRTLTMKGQTNHDHGLIIAGSERGSHRPLMTTSNDEYVEIAGRDGATHRAGGLQPYSFTIEFVKNNTSNDQWFKDRNKIVGWLHSKNEVEIRFDDEPGVYVLGKATSYDLPTHYSSDVSFSVEFTVQPFRYSDTIERELTLVDGKTTVNNKGNYETPYLLMLIVQTATSSLEFGIGNAILKYSGSLRNGDIVTIDTNLLEFRLNDELKVLEVDGAFELLQPGTNEISSTITGPHELVYQERSI